MNIRFMIISAAAIIITAVISTVLFYMVLQEQVFSDLKAYEHIVSQIDPTELNIDKDEIRITWIDKDGTVIYDNEADASVMENHKDRQEVIAAQKYGETKKIRWSSTLSVHTFYYAALKEDGSVLRIAKQSSSIYRVMVNAVMIILAMSIVTFVLCATVAHLLTRRMVEPIERMADNLVLLDASNVYEEIRPFVTTIKEQHTNILNHAKMRQEFTANVSHELKTPMTSMKVLADSLIQQGDQVPAELYREFMQDIVAEIDRENVIISDLLSLVKLDKKAAQLQITTVSINELLEIIMKRLKPLALQRNIELIFESFRPVTAEIDEVKLSLGLTNLIENGIKYNKDDGWIRVTLNADHKYFYVKVADSGVGIPEDCQDQVFDRFYRVDKARSRDTGGTGLGLAITKSVVSLHNGEIKLYSKVGEGTTFTLRIPLKYKG